MTLSRDGAAASTNGGAGMAMPQAPADSVSDLTSWADMPLDYQENRMSNPQAIEVVPTQSTALARHDDELTVDELVAQVEKIKQVMTRVMRVGEHYDRIPGTKKETLLKAGAEKLCLLFRLDPQYETVERQDGNHLTVRSTCTLFHITTGQRRGSGMGSCSTRESKYAWRESRLTCPACKREAIIKGKKEYGGGWVCFKKKGGCGANYEDEDKAITGQPLGRIPNEDLPDTYNTVLKMANKRSLVAAVLNVTAASDIFTQDLEDSAHDAPRDAAPAGGDLAQELEAAAIDVLNGDELEEYRARVKADWSKLTNSERTRLLDVMRLTAERVEKAPQTRKRATRPGNGGTGRAPDDGGQVPQSSPSAADHGPREKAR